MKLCLKLWFLFAAAMAFQCSAMEDLKKGTLAQTRQVNISNNVQLSAVFSSVSEPLKIPNSFNADHTYNGKLYGKKIAIEHIKTDIKAVETLITDHESDDYRGAILLLAAKYLKKLTVSPTEVHEIKNVITLLSHGLFSLYANETGEKTIVYIYPGSLDGSGLIIAGNDEQLLHKIKSIECLRMSSLNIPEFPIALYMLTNLKKLKLSGSSLSFLSSDINKLMALTRLDLFSNKLSKIPAEIGLLTNLTELDVSKNCIKELPSEMSNLINLKELDLSDNQLPYIPLSMAQLEASMNLWENPLINKSVRDPSGFDSRSGKQWYKDYPGIFKNTELAILPFSKID